MYWMWSVCGTMSWTGMFLVDMSQKEYDTVTIPYEYYPLPQKGQDVYGLGRDGKYLVKAEVLRVIMTKVNDRTAVIEVKVPKDMA